MADQPDYYRSYEAPDVANTLVASPRFGHTNDISSLLGSGEESKDYTAGLIAAAVVTAICFTIAILCIPILMCCGKNRVGFLSGAPFSGRNYGDDQSSGRNSLNSFSSPTYTPPKERASGSSSSKRQCCGAQTAALVRGTFLLSGIMFILFAILLVTQGLTNLQGTVQSVHQSSVDIDSIAKEANEILNSGLIGIRGVATSVRDGLNTEFATDNFCPADPTLQSNEAAAEIRGQADEALVLLNVLDSFLGEQVDAVAAAIEQASKGAQQVEKSTGDVDLTDWKALLILIPYTIVPCLLVAAAIMAHFDVELPMFTCAINWFLMPLFILMVLVCAVVASGMIAAASANADFCLPGGRPDDAYAGTSPDTTVWRMLDKKDYKQGALVRQVADYYVAQCQNVSDPYEFLTDYLPNLTDSQKSLAVLTESVNSDGVLADLALYCNRTFDTVDSLLTEMATILDVLLDAIDRTIKLVSCERIVPIYHRAMYDGACQYSVSAVFWVFSAALIMGTFGLLMILFRAACKPNIYDDDKGIGRNSVQNERIVYGDEYSPKRVRCTPKNLQSGMR